MDQQKTPNKRSTRESSSSHENKRENQWETTTWNEWRGGPTSLSLVPLDTDGRQRPFPSTNTISRGVCVCVVRWTFNQPFAFCEDPRTKTAEFKIIGPVSYRKRTFECRERMVLFACRGITLYGSSKKSGELDVFLHCMDLRVKLRLFRFFEKKIDREEPMYEEDWAVPTHSLNDKFNK